MFFCKLIKKKKNEKNHFKKKKKENGKGFFHIYFPYCSVLFLGDTCCDFLHFSFQIIWKDLRELLLIFVIFAIQQKTSQKKKKRYHLR